MTLVRAEESHVRPNAARPAWNLSWLTPIRCRLILVAVLALGFFGHVRYLNHDCPIDLSGDEAQYWDWSRQLDLSYYSKGPLVAYLIRASCAIFGETMPAVRYPALVLGVATSIVTYLLTRKLFGSERLALGTVLLFHIVPLFVAGSVLMTIDPPMFFCWALATYLAAIAAFDDKRWIWVFVGIVIGIGFLAKYATLLWFVGLFGFLMFDSPQRKLWVASIAVLVASLFTIPVVIWNYQHDWVSFRHVAKQTGAAAVSFMPLNFLEFIAGQLGAVGPTLAVLVVAAIVYAVRGAHSGADPDRPKLLMLAWIGLSFLALNALTSLRTKVQLNWPAPAYFTLVILTAYFLSTRLRSLQAWKPWRGWLYATLAIGVVTVPLAHDPSVLYPWIERANQAFGTTLKPARIDFTARLRGWEELGVFVAQERAKLGADTFILCDDYQQSAEMAFYVPGQPTTYCAGSYFGKRLSQYDIWSDRRLDDPASPLIGRNAIYVGKGGSFPDEVVAAFDRVEPLPSLDIVVRGMNIRSFKTWRCHGFRGMTRKNDSEAAY
jgi:undecaprenyl-diphosphatase